MYASEKHDGKVSFPNRNEWEIMIRIYMGNTKLPRVIINLLTPPLLVLTRWSPASLIARKFFAVHPMMMKAILGSLREQNAKWSINALARPSGNDTILLLSGKHYLQWLVRDAGLRILVGNGFMMSPLETRLLLNAPAVKGIFAPSEWVLRSYQRLCPELASKIVIVPTPLAPNKDLISKKTRFSSVHALVYVKRGSEKILEKAVGLLQVRGISHQIFLYGGYKHTDFSHALQKSKFVVWIGESESQGLALLEAWKAGVPTFVYHRPGDIYVSDRDHSFKLGPGEWSPAPYLNPDRGKTWSTLEELTKVIDDTLSNSISFRPAETVSEEFSAKKFLDSLRSSAWN